MPRKTDQTPWTSCLAICQQMGRMEPAMELKTQHLIEGSKPNPDNASRIMVVILIFLCKKCFSFFDYSAINIKNLSVKKKS